MSESVRLSEALSEREAAAQEVAMRIRHFLDGHPSVEALGESRLKLADSLDFYISRSMAEWAK